MAVPPHPTIRQRFRVGNPGSGSDVENASLEVRRIRVLSELPLSCDILVHCNENRNNEGKQGGTKD